VTPTGSRSSTPPRRKNQPSSTFDRRYGRAHQIFASVFIKVLDRADDGLKSSVRTGASRRSCEIAIDLNTQVRDNYTIYRLKASENGSLQLSVVENCPLLKAYDDQSSSLIHVTKIPGRRVEELELLVMKSAGEQVASSEAWASVCLGKIFEAGMVMGIEKQDQIKKNLWRAVGQ
jgi:hypothetical protein